MDARTDRQMNIQTDEWTDRQTVTPSSRRRLHSQWESGDHPSRQGADAITDGGSWGSSFQHTAQQLQQHQAYEEGRGLTPRHTWRPSFSAQFKLRRNPLQRCSAQLPLRANQSCKDIFRWMCQGRTSGKKSSIFHPAPPLSSQDG